MFALDPSSANRPALIFLSATDQKRRVKERVRTQESAPFLSPFFLPFFLACESARNPLFINKNKYIFFFLSILVFVFFLFVNRV